MVAVYRRPSSHQIQRDPNIKELFPIQSSGYTLVTHQVTCFSFAADRLFLFPNIASPVAVVLVVNQ